MTLPSEPSVAGSTEFTPSSQDGLNQFLKDNFAGPKHALMPIGGRTALDFGGRLSSPAVQIDLTRLDRVIDFPARDMTVTVEAGIRIERLSEILRAERQRLPIDIAQSDRATLGGAVATNTSGPRRFGFGTFRDYVIGVTAMTADGRVFHAGGRVVKNVAGYDLCKLLVGSLGTLAVITQVTLKLKPVPESSVLIWATFGKTRDREAAVEGLLTSETRPVAVETLNAAAARLIQTHAQIAVPEEEAALVVGFEGSPRETDWQAETLRKELGSGSPTSFHVVRDADAGRLWNALVDFPIAETPHLTFQANVLPSKLAGLEDQAARFGLATLCRAADGILIGRMNETANAAQESTNALATLTNWTRQNGGSLVLLNGGTDLPEAASAISGHSGALSLMRELKRAFDPAGLLNPGRLSADTER